MFGSLGAPEILIILFLVLLLFGARKLPEMARGMGQAIREFRRGTSEIVNEFQNADRDVTTQNSAPRPAPTPAPAPENPPKSE
jgi:sec-independent protein translocase protein TatA